MTLPKVKPCPRCAGGYEQHVGMIEWEGGWKQVICFRCDYSSAQFGRFVHAIRDWNARERWPVSYIGDRPPASLTQTEGEG